MKLNPDKIYTPSTSRTLRTFHPVYARAHFNENGKLSGSIKDKMGPAYLFLYPFTPHHAAGCVPPDNRELYLVLSQWVRKPKSPI